MINKCSERFRPDSSEICLISFIGLFIECNKFTLRNLLKMIENSIGNFEGNYFSFASLNLILHFIQICLVSRVDVLVAISVDRVFVGFFVGQEVSSIAAFENSACNHLRGDLLAIVNPSNLGELIDHESAEIVVTEVAELARTIVVGLQINE